MEGDFGRLTRQRFPINHSRSGDARGWGGGADSTPPHDTPPAEQGAASPPHPRDLRWCYLLRGDTRPDGRLCSQANEENGATVQEFMERRENLTPGSVGVGHNTPQQRVEAVNTLTKRREFIITYISHLAKLIWLVTIS